jgi:hypothetical protein
VLTLLSLFFPCYYLAASWAISVRFALRRFSAAIEHQRVR